MKRTTLKKLTSIKIGDTVVVNKDIYRIPEDPKPKIPQRELYASTGEIGVVQEIFSSWARNSGRHFNVKVKIGDKIKTFKIGSINKI